MTLKERITEDMKAAMRASEKERLSTIRLVQAAIKQREVDERITLDDTRCSSSSRKWSSSARNPLRSSSRAAGRILQTRSAEIELLQAYLPAQLSDSELDALIRDAVAATGAASIKDMGKVMGVVKSKAAGRGATWRRVGARA